MEISHDEHLKYSDIYNLQSTNRVCIVKHQESMLNMAIRNIPNAEGEKFYVCVLYRSNNYICIYIERERNNINLFLIGSYIIYYFELIVIAIEVFNSAL